MFFLSHKFRNSCLIPTSLKLWNLTSNLLYILIGSIYRNFKLIPYSTLWFQHDCIIDELMRSKIILWRNVDFKVKNKNRSYSIIYAPRERRIYPCFHSWSTSFLFLWVGIHDPLKANVKWENTPCLVIVEQIK